MMGSQRKKSITCKFTFKGITTVAMKIDGINVQFSRKLLNDFDIYFIFSLLYLAMFQSFCFLENQFILSNVNNNNN